jgi:hypothetical protein
MFTNDCTHPVTLFRGPDLLENPPFADRFMSRDPWENPQEHPMISCKIPVIQLACILGLSENGEHPPIHGNFMGKSR